MEYGDRLEITTPEGVAVALELAGIGSRSLAAMLDLVIQGLIGLAGGLIIFVLLDGGVALLVAYVALFLLIFGYDVTFEVLNRGRTPGKRAASLRVVRDTGAPVTFVTSAIRNVLRIVDILPVFYGVAMLSVFLTRHHQRLGDLAAGTVVVHDRPATTVHIAPLQPPARVYGWDTSTITAEDLAIARAFLERRETLTAGARLALADDLATRLRGKVAGAPDQPAEQFLEALVASRE
jgi:uncharacterized RDD family membrane protein YckC